MPRPPIMSREKHFYIFSIMIFGIVFAVVLAILYFTFFALPSDDPVTYKSSTRDASKMQQHDD